MKRLALLCVCVTIGIVACTGASSGAGGTGASSGAGSATSAAPSTTVSATPAGKNAASVVTSYYRAVAAQKYRQAYTYLAAKATGPDGRRLSLPAFLQLAHMMDNMGGPVTHFSVGGFTTTIVMTLDRKKYGPYHAHLHLARSGNNWKITSIDRI
jgi:hypothetical protein